MSRKKFPAMVALVAALALVASACGGDGGGGTTAPDSNVKKGGILRMQTDAFEWASGFDPTAEYLGFAWEFYSAIHRTLMTYNHRSGAKGGSTPIPDVATDTGQVSADGKEWTFKIKKGVKFSPPLNREVTSKDFANAFNRLANETLSAGGYASYYDDEIVGFKDVLEKKAQTVSGITTPDDQTIVFKLTKPVGDFRYRLTLPATSAMPNEATKCFDKNGEYGRFQIGAGPYMIEGIDKLPNPAGGCDAFKKTAAAGFDPTSHLRIRRNPNYDAKTDSKEARSNNIDGVDLTLNTNTEDIFNRIEQGTVDAESAQPPPGVIQKGQTDPNFKDNFRLDPGDRTWYLFFNMTLPPFDDVAVRKAVNWVMDKEGLVRARGGTAAGPIAEHIVPPDVLGGKLKVGEFDPYKSANGAGDVEKAKEEMKKSKYDTNKDGLCDVSCEFTHGTRATPPYTVMAPIIEASLKKIGLVAKTQQLQKFYATVQVPTQTPALGSGAGWGKDYADASTFFEPLLSSSVITKDATQNFAFLGLTQSQAGAVGVKFPAGGVPSADADISACAAKLGDERINCWVELDKKMMTEYVPWVPYLWGNNFTVISDAVTTYEYDQFAGELSLVHIGLDTSKQKS